LTEQSDGSRKPPTPPKTKSGSSAVMENNKISKEKVKQFVKAVRSAEKQIGPKSELTLSPYRPLFKVKK